MCLWNENYIEFICNDESQNFFLIRQEAIDIPRRNTKGSYVVNFEINVVMSPIKELSWLTSMSIFSACLW